MTARLCKGSRCPSCLEGRLIPIAYGFPSIETVARYREGKVALGGCVISEVFDEERFEIVSADPQPSCPRCEGRFFRAARERVINGARK